MKEVTAKLDDFASDAADDYREILEACSEIAGEGARELLDAAFDV